MKKSLLALVALAVLPFFAAAQELPKLNVTLMSCTELLCTNQKGVFLVNESAYLDYNSTERGISYSATITFPDGKKYQTTFPNRIISNVSGNYTLELTVWKDGYQDTTVSKVVQFVEKQPSSSSNPITFNPVPILAVAAAVLTVFGLWRYSKWGRKRRSTSLKASLAGRCPQTPSFCCDAFFP